MTEWPVQFLSRPRRTDRTIPDFLAPDAPPNRLEGVREIKDTGGRTFEALIAEVAALVNNS